MHRVAITGLGVICALGKTTKDFWASLLQGSVGIGPITAIDRSCLRFQNGAEVRDYNPLDYFEPRQADLMDRFAQFAVIAAKQAVQDAGLELTPELCSSTAVITGACVGGQSSEDQGFYDIYRANRNRVHPMTIPKTMANAGASLICMELGITGAAFTISTACSSAAHAVGLGYSMVASGAAPVALVGGSEAPFSLGLLKAWEALRVVSTGTCRPFSKDRSGMILGEGGAMLVLERMDHAQARGIHIYGEVAGFGMSSDACHITHPSSDGAAAAMQRALAHAEIAPEQVGYINAHGTGTEVNDSTETAAIRKVFGAHADKLAVSSTKSMHGHTLGAAGALEAAAAVLALRHGVLPPTANYTTPDPACDLDVIPNAARKAEVDYCLSNSFAFGGLNAALVFRRA
jgi:nodulation protein E